MFEHGIRPLCVSDGLASGSVPYLWGVNPPEIPPGIKLRKPRARAIQERKVLLTLPSVYCLRPEMALRVNSGSGWDGPAESLEVHVEELPAHLKQLQLKHQR